jgi:D-psicose/D-tagatose/L-ribulose 3-epimerase
MPNFSRRAVLFTAAGAALQSIANQSFAKIRGVEFGVTGNPDAFSNADKFGFDYFEPSAAAVAAMTPSAFASFRDQVQASRIRCLSFNSLIRSLKVVGPAATPDAVANYLDSTLDRCRNLGGRVAVWGSASSREVPAGYSHDQAWTEIKAFLARAGDIAKAKQMVIGIEPLRKQESNIINTGAEALKLVHEVNHPQVKMIIDYYHLRVENEDPEIVRTAKDHIVHLHFANPNGRLWPKLPDAGKPDEDPQYRRFFEILKQINYTGGLSIEGTGTFENDAAAGLSFFRKELS